MALNSNLLKCYLERDIEITEFLKRLESVEDLQGEERKKLQDQIAKELESEFPLREKKTSGRKQERINREYNRGCRMLRQDVEVNETGKDR